jgi:outer membrane protein OmpA-like peptidoglycan-associated protein
MRSFRLASLKVRLLKSVMVGMILAFALAVTATGCAKNAQAPAGSAAQPSDESSAEQSVSQSSQAPESAQPTESAQPQAVESSTGPVDLLSARQGTLLRAWPATSLDSKPEGLLLDSPGWTAKEGSSGPYVFVYELAGLATVQQFQVPDGGDPASLPPAIHFAVSTTSADSGFSDAGSIQPDATTEKDLALQSPVKARWIKITVDQRGAATQLYGFAAMGTLDPRPAAPPLAGVWKYYDDDAYENLGQPRDAAGAFPNSGDATLRGDNDGLLEIRQTGSDISAGICSRDIATAFRGTETGDSLTAFTGSSPLSPAVINSEGSVMVAVGGDHDWFATRLTGRGSCDTVFTGGTPHGTGTPALVIFDGNASRYAPYYDPTLYPGFRFSPELATFFDPKTLGSYQIAVLTNVCNAASLLTDAQGQALADWVYSGNKLIIHDADDCTQTDYSFLPYSFASSNPGKNAARGTNLVLVESNTLGSAADDRVHFVDVKGYLADSGQQLGDSNVVTTQDKHWCGHLYGTNVLNQNGFIQMFAPFGQGMMIFDGLDSDDSDIAQYQKIALLELLQPPDASLACDQLVAAPFTIAPSSADIFSPGKAEVARFPLSVFASHGFVGTVMLSVTPPANATWGTSLSITHVALNGGTAPFDVTIDVPQDARAGAYPFVVNGTDAKGDESSAVVTLASSAASQALASPGRAASLPLAVKIAKTLAISKRVAVYGIYFDFASAKLKSESTPVLKEIADALIANPSWKLTIEGHTDNVGGSAYNLTLSQDRAAAVKIALVGRYHINAGRLSTIGFGFSRPVASNDTPQGRALNRRVELVRH